MGLADTHLGKVLLPEFNVPRDEVLYAKIMVLRSAMIALEKKKSDHNPVPPGSETLLQEMLGLEPEIVGFPAFMGYCEETAHACMLNDDSSFAVGVFTLML